MDLVTLVMPDGHINISHFHLEQNVVLTEGAAICLAASTLPGDSLEAEDKHICTSNTPQQSVLFRRYVSGRSFLSDIIQLVSH